MAKFDGIFEIQGTLKGMTFYKSKDGLLIRGKGGVSKKRIKNDPAFQRTRENGVEFGHCASMGMLLRKSVSNSVSLAKDYRVTSRLGQALSRVKNLDFVSIRGQRKVHIGIQSAEGKNVLRGFNFNKFSAFNSVFREAYELDIVSGEVEILDFNPTSNLSIPQGATHCSFSTSISSLDFEMGTYETKQGQKTNFPIVDALMDITLICPMPTASGSVFFYFLIEFFQELNGAQYPLKNNAHNVLYLMEII